MLIPGKKTNPGVKVSARYYLFKGFDKDMFLSSYLKT